MATSWAMRPHRSIANVGDMTRTTTVSFEVDERSQRAEVPPELWTDFVVDGHRIFIRTQRPVRLLSALCDSALAKGVELQEIEVKTTGSVARASVPPPGGSISSRRPPAAWTRSAHEASPT
jgi:hypothetical protein